MSVRRSQARCSGSHGIHAMLITLGDSNMQRRGFIKKLAVSAAVAAAYSYGSFALAADTIKVGILHSLSGTMAISETVAQGRDADGDRRHQCQGRRDGQEARARGRRPGLELAAVRREGQAAARPGQGCGGIRLLDLGVAQIRAAGVQGTERPAVLPGAVRRRRTRRRTCSTPAPRPTSRRFRRSST